MATKRGLGRGLDALIPSTEAGSGVSQLPVSAIARNPLQPRTRFGQAELEELSNSIREHGVIQPLIVTLAGGQPGQYTLIAGERRLEAAKLAGLPMVPAIIREASGQELLELALVENIQRSDLGPLETALAYKHLVDDFHLSHEEIAGKVGKKRVTVTNTLRLLKLAPAAQQALVDGTITEGHARALLGLDSPAAQEAALKVVNAKGLSVRETEELVRRLSGERLVSRSRPAPSPDLLALEERLRASLGTKVSLRSGARGKGSLVIHYYSPEELDALLNRLLDE